MENAFPVVHGCEIDDSVPLERGLSTPRLISDFFSPPQLCHAWGLLALNFSSQ